MLPKMGRNVSKSARGRHEGRDGPNVLPYVVLVIGIVLVLFVAS
jgi:hypothetical protein